jgi:phosphoglycerate dehydrogenase-like enzyme
VFMEAGVVDHVLHAEPPREVGFDFNVIQILGAGFDFFFLPAVSTRDGILVTWKPSAWSVSNASARQFLVLARVRQISGDLDWWLTMTHQGTTTNLHSLRSFTT